MSFIEQVREHSRLGRIRRGYEEDTPRFKNTPLEFKPMNMVDTLRFRRNWFDMNMKASEVIDSLDMVIKSICKDRQPGQRNS